MCLRFLGLRILISGVRSHFLALGKVWDFEPGARDKGCLWMCLRPRDFTIFSTLPGTFLIWENQLSSFSRKFRETLAYPSLSSPLLGLQWLSRSMVHVFIKPNQRVPKWMVHVTLMLMISVHKFICPYLAYKEERLVTHLALIHWKRRTIHTTNSIQWPSSNVCITKLQ